MSAVLALHHGGIIAGHLADRYGNDPFVWTNPFLWSHCHARSRNPEFGLAKKGPFVCGKDAVFFVSHHPQTQELVCDCVFVIAKVLPIREVEAQYAVCHPIRHYHFDQEREPHHKNSTITRVADSQVSFIPYPPAPIGTWIQSYVVNRKLTVHEYFNLKKIKNVRAVTTDPQGLYNRIDEWSSKPGHQKLACLPLSSLQQLPVRYPAGDNIDWGVQAGN